MQIVLDRTIPNHWTKFVGANIGQRAGILWVCQDSISSVSHRQCRLLLGANHPLYGRQPQRRLRTALNINSNHRVAYRIRTLAGMCLYADFWSIKILVPHFVTRGGEATHCATLCDIVASYAGGGVFD